MADRACQLLGTPMCRGKSWLNSVSYTLFAAVNSCIMIAHITKILFASVWCQTALCSCQKATEAGTCPSRFKSQGKTLTIVQIGLWRPNNGFNWSCVCWFNFVADSDDHEISNRILKVQIKFWYSLLHEKGYWQFHNFHCTRTGRSNATSLCDLLDQYIEPILNFFSLSKSLVHDACNVQALCITWYHYLWGFPPIFFIHVLSILADSHEHLSIILLQKVTRFMPLSEKYSAFVAVFHALQANAITTKVIC